MFSGIHSLIFGKKHHRGHNKTGDNTAGGNSSSGNDNEFVIVERRHSDYPDVNPGLYPTINTLGTPETNLPYGVSPSMPDLRPTDSPVKIKERGTTDLLHEVPFELAAYIDTMTNEKDEKFSKLMQRIKDLLSDNVLSDRYNYDFNLEQRILSEYET